MTISMLGKNGDQLQRLATTPAQVLVVQHCHEIRPEVFALIRSAASDFRNIRRFMLIDGFATARLLAASGHLDAGYPPHSSGDERVGPTLPATDNGLAARRSGCPSSLADADAADLERVATLAERKRPR